MPPHQALFSSQALWAAGEFSLPVLTLAILWQLFMRCQELIKRQALFVMLAFFCAPLVVRQAFATGEESSPFMLFLHPALSLCALLLFCSCVAFSKDQATKKRIAACALSLCVAVLACLLPPVMFSLWTLKIAGNLYVYSSAAFIIVSLALFFAQHKAQLESDEDLPVDEQKPQVYDESVPKGQPSSSPWGWDIKAGGEPTAQLTVQADDSRGVRKGSQRTDDVRQATQPKQARSRGGGASSKRGRRSRRGKNASRRKRKR